jgi:hypothetical protein
VIKLAGEISPEFDEEKIHKVRTTIKKMRAIGDWADVPVKHFFKKYYRILGNIRDVQLAISKIKNGPFTDWLESNLHHFKAEWQKQYDHKKLKKQLQKLGQTIEDAGAHNKKHSLKFEKHKEQTLATFMHDRPLNDDQIHSGRKTIKEIGFLNKWEKNDSASPFKELSDETGNYMDRISGIRLLEQYLAAHPDDVNSNEVAALLENWKKEKEQEKSRLLQSISSLPG